MGRTKHLLSVVGCSVKKQQKNITMKAVALILALAVITGCNARAVRQAEAEASPVLWQDNVDRFWQYVNELSSKADGVLENMRASQLSRELETLIADTMAELNTYKADVEVKLAPYTQDTAGQIGQDLQLLADRLNKDSEEIRNTVATYLGELQSRTTQNIDMVRERVEPFVSQAHQTAAEKLGSFTVLLKNQAEGLGQQLETQAEGLREQLETTAQDLRTALESKIDELT